MACMLENIRIKIHYAKMMWARSSIAVCCLLIFSDIANSDDCSRKITRQSYYSSNVRAIKVINHFGDIFVKKHSDESEVRILVTANLTGTLLHAANPPIVFSNDRDGGLVMVGPLAEDSSSMKPSLFNSWILLPLIATLMSHRRSFLIVAVVLVSIWIGMTTAQDNCPTGNVEVLVPRNMCFSVSDSSMSPLVRSLTILDCVDENRPQVTDCTISGYLYPNCTEGSNGVEVSWDVMFSTATNNTFPMADSPILIEWSLVPVGCPSCSQDSSFATLFELHQVADLRNFRSWSKVLPSQYLPLVNGSSVMLLLRVDTPMEGYSTPKECRTLSGSTIFTNNVPPNPGPLNGKLSFNTTEFDVHHTAIVMTASEVCFLLRGFENNICSVLTYRASLGTTMCGNDSINWTTLSTQTYSDDIIRSCLESSTELTSGRYYVAVEAVDYVGLSRVVCPDVSFVVDRIAPKFVSVMSACMAVTGGGSIPLVSWNIQALSGIEVVRYNISATSTGAQNAQDFLQFPDAVIPLQSNHDLRPVLQGYSGDAYLTLQVESGVGLITTRFVGRISCNG